MVEQQFGKEGGVYIIYQIFLSAIFASLYKKKIKV